MKGLDGKQAKEVERYYDEVYYADDNDFERPSLHHYRLARRLDLRKDLRVLDVACGAGSWLKVARECGAEVCGLDVSSRAVARARIRLPDADIRHGAAEQLPWSDNTFDLVTCLGALEHFLDQERAVAEIRRVLKPAGFAVLLVPNADFLTRRLGLYGGTEQASVIEVVRSIQEWEALFKRCDLQPLERWKDLHVLSWNWIRRGKIWNWPFRAAQALALSVWPLRWQYQIYFRCLPASDYGSG